MQTCHRGDAARNARVVVVVAQANSGSVRTARLAATIARVGLFFFVVAVAIASRATDFSREVRPDMTSFQRITTGTRPQRIDAVRAESRGRTPSPPPARCPAEAGATVPG
jgi:hypothetical protein